MRTTVEIRGEQVLVARNALGWRVHASHAEARARYLDDALTRTFPDLPPRERERLMLQLLEWAHRRRLRLRRKRRRPGGSPPHHRRAP